MIRIIVDLVILNWNLFENLLIVIWPFILFLSYLPSCLVRNVAIQHCVLLVLISYILSILSKKTFSDWVIKYS
jgi:hypothetical protein